MQVERLSSVEYTPNSDGMDGGKERVGVGREGRGNGGGQGPEMMQSARFKEEV